MLKPQTMLTYCLKIREGELNKGKGVNQSNYNPWECNGDFFRLIKVYCFMTALSRHSYQWKSLTGVFSIKHD